MAYFLKAGPVAQCGLIVFIAINPQFVLRAGADVTFHEAGAIFDCFGIEIALQFVGAAGRPVVA